MHDPGLTTFVIVTAVLLFFGLGIAIMVIMDHKARLPGKYEHGLFTISGTRREHPVEAFMTTSILMGIILALVISLLAALSSQLGIFKEDEKPELLVAIGEERMVEKTRHFHNTPVQTFADQGKKVACFYCHGDYPHSKEPMIRTLMNMHTQFIGCMTCHTNEKKVPENTLSFKWLNYSGISVQGSPFGTALDPNTGYLIKTDDYFSKIVVSQTTASGTELLEMPEDKPQVQEFLAIRDKLSDKDRESIKKRFHKIVRPKGRFCSRCHTNASKSYIPFKELGFSDRRIQDLTNLNIIGLVEKYQKFHIPDLLGATSNTIKEKSTSNTATKNMHKDPANWWGKNYDAPK
ncbi:MAG: cytochrome c family protein [Gammaproteobacteria bacterium]|nr:cytochrome c family protein [Gammaproteobacteria bacterium]